MSDQTGSPPAGWYNDPSAPDQQRWWDGTQWGSSIRPLDDRPPPPPAPMTMPPPAAHPGDDPFAPAPAHPDPMAPTGPPPGMTPGLDPMAPAPSGGGRSSGLTVMLVVVCLGLVLAGCVAVLAVGRSSESSSVSSGEETEFGAVGSGGSGGDQPSEIGGADTGDDPENEATIETEPAPDVDPTDQGSRADPLPYDQPVEVTWRSFGDSNGSRWTTTVSPPRDITDEVLAANEFNDPPPDGVRFVGFEVSMTLTDAAEEPLAPGFDVTFEILGGATARVYDFSTIETASFGCGVVANDFDDFGEAFVGGTIAGTVCVPAPAEDLDHPDTRVALSFLATDTRAIFGP